MRARAAATAANTSSSVVPAIFRWISSSSASPSLSAVFLRFVVAIIEV